MTRILKINKRKQPHTKGASWHLRFNHRGVDYPTWNLKKINHVWCIFSKWHNSRTLRHPRSPVNTPFYIIFCSARSLSTNVESLHHEAPWHWQQNVELYALRREEWLQWNFQKKLLRLKILQSDMLESCSDFMVFYSSTLTASKWCLSTIRHWHHIIPSHIVVLREKFPKDSNLGSSARRKVHHGSPKGHTISRREKFQKIVPLEGRQSQQPHDTYLGKANDGFYFQESSRSAESKDSHCPSECKDFFEEPYPVHAHLLRNSRSRKATYGFVTDNSSSFKGEIHTREAQLDISSFLRHARSMHSEAQAPKESALSGDTHVVPLEGEEDEAAEEQQSSSAEADGEGSVRSAGGPGSWLSDGGLASERASADAQAVHLVACPQTCKAGLRYAGRLHSLPAHTQAGDACGHPRSCSTSGHFRSLKKTTAPKKPPKMESQRMELEIWGKKERMRVQLRARERRALDEEWRCGRRDRVWWSERDELQVSIPGVSPGQSAFPKLPQRVPNPHG